MGRSLTRVAMLVAMLAAGAAFAQGGPPPDRMERKGQHMGPPPDRPMHAPRWAGYPGNPPQHMERMSPEERRQLRRDIHQHGRDVYRPQREPEKQQ